MSGRKVAPRLVRVSAYRLRLLESAGRMLALVAETNTDDGNGWGEEDWDRLDRIVARLRRASGGRA